MNLYCVYDKVREESGAIEQFKNDKVAWRWYQIVLAKSPDVSQDDFELRYIGNYDVETCEIFSEVQAINISLSLVEDESEYESGV